ncbi:hypothetical protein P4S65_18010 [Pseudoalteromonas sp. B131b]
METVEVEPMETKKRGFWLTAFLILMFIANPFTTLILLVWVIVDLKVKSDNCWGKFF